jgi:hypothetical protein
MEVRRKQAMPMPQKHPLRPVTEQEKRELRRIVKASSERVDVVRRARALLAVVAKQTFPQAAAVAGFAEARSASQLVERFNRLGLAALLIGSGRGRKPTYTREQRARIVAEGQREADRQAEQTATWSLLRLAGGAAPERSALQRQRNDSPSAPRGRLPLSAHPSLDPHGLRGAQAQKRHGNDL